MGHPHATACFYIPRFALAYECALRRELRDLPVALGGGIAGPRIQEASEDVLGSGVSPGMPLREAIALLPSVVIIEPRPALYEAAWHEIVQALQQISPVIEDERMGLAYIGTTGLEQLYDDQLPAALLACSPSPLAARTGIAPGRFVAFVAATSAAPGETIVVGSQDSVDFLAPHPVEVLDWQPEALRRLRKLGIRTLSDLAALPRQAMQAQFGWPGARAWDLAHGRDDRGVLAEPYEEPVSEAMDFAPPLVSRDSVLAALEPMLVRALRQPPARERFARGLALVITTERQQIWNRSLTLKEPSGDRERLWRALRTVIEYVELPGSVAALRLELRGLTREGGRQGQLFREWSTLGGRREELEEMLRQLKARYNHCPVGRVVEVEPWSRVPERRMALVDFDP